MVTDCQDFLARPHSQIHLGRVLVDSDWLWKVYSLWKHATFRRAWWKVAHFSIIDSKWFCSGQTSKVRSVGLRRPRFCATDYSQKGAKLWGGRYRLDWRICDCKLYSSEGTRIEQLGSSWGVKRRKIAGWISDCESSESGCESCWKGPSRPVTNSWWSPIDWVYEWQ